MAKQIIVVRTDLKMKKGKIAAQVAHASLGAILQLCTFVESKNNIVYMLHYTKGSTLHDWLQGIFTKVVVGIDGEEALLQLYQNAKSANLNAILIKDRGFTQIAPDTYTCVGIGPAEDEDLAPLTSHLKLL